MADNTAAEIVRKGIEALNAQDHEALLEMLDDDVVWHVIGSTEPVRGKAALATGLGAGGRDFSVSVEVHDVTSSDDHVVALVRAHATRGERTLDYDTAEIFHVRDGKVTERWAFSDDTARITAFFS